MAAACNYTFEVEKLIVAQLNQIKKAVLPSLPFWWFSDHEKQKNFPNVDTVVYLRCIPTVRRCWSPSRQRQTLPSPSPPPHSHCYHYCYCCSRCWREGRGRRRRWGPWELGEGGDCGEGYWWTCGSFSVWCRWTAAQCSLTWSWGSLGSGCCW